MKVIALLAGLGVAVASVVAFSAATAPEPDQPTAPKPITQPIAGSGKAFTTKFNDLDTSIWSISDGWSNGPYMVNDWRKSQTHVDGNLGLALSRRDGAASGYSSGEVQSRATYGHGYFEVTMQAAPGSGIVTGFFTYTGPPFGRPWNEIDVEILGRNTREASLTYFYEGKPLSHVEKLNFDAAAALHHYAFDWQPGYIRWYIDGQLVHEATSAEMPLPNEAQKIMMHLWGTERSEDWAGTFDPSAVPVSMLIGCVAYSLQRPRSDKCRD